MKRSILVVLLSTLSFFSAMQAIPALELLGGAVWVAGSALYGDEVSSDICGGVHEKPPQCERNPSFFNSAGNGLLLGVFAGVVTAIQRPFLPSMLVIRGSATIAERVERAYIVGSDDSFEKSCARLKLRELCNKKRMYDLFRVIGAVAGLEVYKHILRQQSVGGDSSNSSNELANLICPMALAAATVGALAGRASVPVFEELHENLFAAKVPKNK